MLYIHILGTLLVTSLQVTWMQEKSPNLAKLNLSKEQSGHVLPFIQFSVAGAAV